MTEQKITYYNTKRIDKKKATYNVIFGERSNGKTYSLLKKGLENYFNDGSQMGYVRRWKEDIIGRRAQQLFAGINENREVEKLSNGEFTGVHYWAGKFYLCNYDDKGKAIYGDQHIVAHSFALSDGEHDKSTSFPSIKIVIFDEFLTSRVYLPDEFVMFMNTISTIVRKRDDVAIYMLGNTVNKFCPYFQEMGLKHIPKMEQGTIDVYTYGESKLTVAVEYCASQVQNKKSNKYFAFDNPKLNMITSGAWEIDIYPHLPMKFRPKDVMFKFYIEFNDIIYQCEVVSIGDVMFVFIHLKTTEIKDRENQLVYGLEYRPEPSYNSNIYRPINKTQDRIRWFFLNNRVYYQNNEIGDAISNYLKICKGR